MGTGYVSFEGGSGAIGDDGDGVDGAEVEEGLYFGYSAGGYYDVWERVEVVVFTVRVAGECVRVCGRIKIKVGEAG